MKKAVVVLPTYNERDGVQKLIPDIFKHTSKVHDWDVHILVADDSSPDGTAEVVRELQKKYKHRLHLQVNKGKVGLGQAYLNAFAYAIEKYQPDVIFEMDADGQHPANILPNFLKKIDQGADFVIGSRYIKGGSIPSHWSLWRKFTSVIGNIVAQVSFMNFKVRDWTSGYRCIKSSYLEMIIPKMKGHTGYVFQVALLDKAFKEHLVITETPLNFTDRVNGKSKMQSFRFMFDTIWYILSHSTFIRFGATGLFGAAIDFGIAAILIGMFFFHKPTASAISAEIAIICNFFINNFWSFNHKRVKGSYIRKLVKFNLVASGAIFIQWAGLWIALHLFGDIVYPLPYGASVPSWVVFKALIIGAFVIPYSYIMYNTLIWKSPARAKIYDQ